MDFKMWIGGQFVEAESGETAPVINPATEEVFAHIPMGGKAEVDKAVAAAQKAWPEWASKTQAERSRIMFKIAAAIRPHAEELGKLDVLDHGTCARMATGMMMGLASDFEYAAMVSRSFVDEMVPGKDDGLNFVRREPVGIVGIITPWNAPLGVIGTKMSAALCVGNACIVKPPSIDSTTALKFAEILDTIEELPKGIVNIITGPGGTVGDAMSAHPGIDMITFTGSSETGRAIMAASANTVKRLALELGGKNPFILLDDADVDAAVARGVMTLAANTGQVCACPGKYYVPENLHDEFVEKFVARFSKVTYGDPNDPTTMMGPVVSAEHRDKIESYYKIGVEEGAKLVLGGKRPAKPEKGYYVMPTVFTGVTQNMRLSREEIFGPVACIIKYSSKDNVVELANDNIYGLCASVWSKNLPRANKVAYAIRAGAVWVNNHMVKGEDLPWGGYKQSGFGKENALVGLEEYVHKKWVHLNMSETK